MYEKNSNRKTDSKRDPAVFHFMIEKLDWGIPWQSVLPLPGSGFDPCHRAKIPQSSQCGPPPSTHPKKIEQLEYPLFPPPLKVALLPDLKKNSTQ